MPANIKEQGVLATYPVGEAAEKEAPGGRTDADHAQQQHRRGGHHAVIPCIGHEMDERHKHPERADQAGSVEADETARPDRRVHRRTFVP
jgi:hypothetical protein